MTVQILLVQVMTGNPFVAIEETHSAPTNPLMRKKKKLKRKSGKTGRYEREKDRISGYVLGKVCIRNQSHLTKN